MKNVRRDPTGAGLIQIKETGWLEKQKRKERPISKKWFFAEVQRCRVKRAESYELTGPRFSTSCSQCKNIQVYMQDFRINNSRPRCDMCVCVWSVFVYDPGVRPVLRPCPGHAQRSDWLSGSPLSLDLNTTECDSRRGRGWGHDTGSLKWLRVIVSLCMAQQLDLGERKKYTRPKQMTERTILHLFQ